MSEFRAHSFDPVRVRVVPATLFATNAEGVERSVHFDTLTLVVAVKAHCDGCLAFLREDFAPLGGVSMVALSAEAIDDPAWRDVPQEILIAPEAMQLLGVLAAPYYALVDPESLTVVVEGALFSVAQVASEIATYRTG